MSIITIDRIRKKYPDYNDLSDRDLADKLHDKFYSDIPKEDFYNRIGLNKKSPFNFSTPFDRSTTVGNVLSGNNKDQLDYITGKGRTPVDSVRDLLSGSLTGLGKGGQFIAKTMTGGYAPTVNMEEMFSPVSSPKRSLGGDILRGVGEYSPYSVAGGPGLLGELFGGASYGAATNNESPLKGAMEGSLLNALTHGTVKGINELRPSNLFRGSLSPDELKENLEAANGTNTGLGDVIGSPFLKRQYENVLSKFPFSGANEKLNRSAKSVFDKGNNALSILLSGNSPENANDQLSNALLDQFKSNRDKKNSLYKSVNDLADKSDFIVSSDNFIDKLKDYSDAIESTNFLKYEPDINKIYTKIKKYGTNEKGISLKEANILKSRFNDYSNQLSISPDPDKRYLSGIFKNLSNSLKSDIRDSIDNSNNNELKSSYEDAEKNYKEKFSPFLDKSIYRFIGGNADPDTLTQNFVKISKGADRSKELSKLTSILPENKKGLLAYSYFSRSLDKDGNLNPGKLSTLINNLGKNQFKALVPDSSMREELNKFNKLYSMNNKSVNLMQNPATGQQALDIMPLLLSHAGSSLAGGALGGFPGALAGLVAPGLASRPIVNWLTSPSVRESIVKKMIENKPLNKRITQMAQPLVQGIVNR